MALYVSRKLGKKKGAIIIGLVAFLGAPLPILLRVLGLLPENGTPFVFWFVFITGVIDVGLIICYQILSSSMIADLVEQSELETGRRSEGVFFSTVTFIRKSVQGFGLILASFVLYVAHPLGPRSIRFPPKQYGVWVPTMCRPSWYCGWLRSRSSQATRSTARLMKTTCASLPKGVASARFCQPSTKPDQELM